MKHTTIKIVIVLICMLFPMSCGTDFLDTKPVDKVPSELTWSDGPLSQAFVFNVYSFLGYGGFEEQMLAAYTDEAMFTHAGRNINTFTEGIENPSNLAWFSPTYEWKKMYTAIREANVAIENLPISTFEDTALRDKLLGESYFLRAYYYHQLVRFYGGVPIVKTSYGLNEDYTIVRSTFEECVNFIVSDLDQAATLLDGLTMDPGRASKLAALSLKSRILLYAASDLHDQVKASAASSLIDGYADYAFLGYTTGSQASRWQAAKDAALAALNLGIGYKLNLVAPATFDEAVANHVALSMGGGSGIADKAAGAELILQRTQTPLYTVENNWPLGGIHFGINNGPNGYHNWAGNTPIQQLVDDYQMMDGTEFDYGNSAHTSAPYENREPRFYATILYDGATWKPRPSDVATYDNVNQIQTGYYDGGLDGTGKPIIINGVDTRESPIENWNGSRTHYYVRKFIDSDPNVVDNQSGSQVVPWPFIRYTELVLNYVEACLGTNDEATAITWLNKIRFRAGLPAAVQTGSALVDLYRNERRLELAYEEHRYHDARRWMIAPTTLGRGIKIMRVDATLKVGKTPLSPYRFDKTVYDYTYTVQNNTDNETRTWNDKMYFRPIGRDEINRNEKLKDKNNPGYGNE